MSQALYLRKYIRIPFGEEIIVEDQEGHLKGTIHNISIKGILINGLKRDPVDQYLWALIKIKKMRMLNALTRENLIHLQSEKNLGKIFKTKIDIVRRNPQLISDASYYQIAGTFTEEEEEMKSYLSDYINNYTFNIVHLIKLLQKKKISEEEKSFILILSKILDRREKNLLELRENVLRDFQNI